MQSEREPEEVSRLFRQRFLDGRRGGQFAISQYIQTVHKYAVFTAPHHSSNAGEVQHLKDNIRHAVQFGDESVFRIEAAKLCVIRGIHNMIAVCFCADRQIPQILQRDDAAVGVYFSLHLYGEHPLKGDPLYLVQCRKLCGEVIELVETDVQPVQMGREILKGIVVFDLHVQDVVCLKPHLFHGVPHLPQGGGQVQLGIGCAIRRIVFSEIHTQYFLTQGSSLPFPAVVHSRQGLRRGRPSRTWNPFSWLFPVRG